MAKNNRSDLIVVKASGEYHPFSMDKVRRSLRKAGATDKMIEEIIENIRTQLFDGISSRRIYQIAFRLLKRYKNKPYAARFNLKKAIFDMGPSGYAFEHFVAKLFYYRGYEVYTGQMYRGRCVTHEIDVIAQNHKESIFAECKYHNKPGAKSGVQVPLYLNSRFDDIKKVWEKHKENVNRSFKGWIITNTFFSDDAIQYGGCVGLNLVAWGYPEKGNLQHLVEEKRLYPITTLTTLTKAQKDTLLQNKVIMCQDLIENPEELKSIGIPSSKFRQIIKESKMLIE